MVLIGGKFEMKREITKYEKLGARWLKKVVLQLEKVKYIVLRPFKGLIIKWFDWLIDKKSNKLLMNNVNSDVSEHIIYGSIIQKMMIRKEFQDEQARNYHIWFGNIGETLYYLRINKRIHTFHMKKNMVLIVMALLSLLVIKNPCWSLGLKLFVGLEALLLVKNFECVNLQNYNIDRINQCLKKRERLEQRKNDKMKKARDMEGNTQNSNIKKAEDLNTNIGNNYNCVTALQSDDITIRNLENNFYNGNSGEVIKPKTLGRIK